MGYLVDDLLTSIKSRSAAPISQSTFADADLLTIATEELRLKLVSGIMSEREDFFLQSGLVTTTAALDNYALPRKAIGNALKCVFVVDSTGGRRLLQRVDVDRVASFGLSSAQPERFYFKGNQIVLIPAPTTAFTLDIVHFARPSELIATSSCAKITAVSSIGGLTTMTVNTDLTGSLSTGSLIDIISSVSPFLSGADRAAITTISATQIVCATTLVSDSVGNVLPQVGDYICPTGYSNIPQIPIEFHPVLAQMTANRLLASLGDLNKWNAGRAQAKEDFADALKLIKNRAESSPEHITNRNGLSTAFSRRLR